jgi:heat shock protein HslJ
MRRPLVILLAALLALAACGDDGDDGDDVAADATTAPAEDPIAGRTFEAVTLEGGTHTLVEGVPLRIAFTDDEITVETGCNRLSGTYAVEGPILVVRGLGGTEMACEPPLMAQEEWISGVLTTRPVITPQAPDGLLLTKDDAALTLEDPTGDAATTDVELVGPTWTVDTLIDAEAAGSVPEGVTATITFSADGTYQVSAGCNTGRGTYAEAGAGIYQIEPPALTRRRCDDEAMDVEAAVVAALDGEVTASTEGGRLTLIALDGAGLSLSSS